MKRIKEYQFYSQELQREVTITIRLPKEYDSSKEYATLYMHDGQNLFFKEKSAFGMIWDVDEHLLNLESQGLEEFIVVGINSNTDYEGIARLAEYSLWENHKITKLFSKSEYPYQVVPGLANQYLSFLKTTVIPFVRSNYSSSTKREKNHIMGSSMGGLVSLVIGLKEQELFQNIYCLSNAFWYAFDDLVEFIENTKIEKSLNIYLDVGTKEFSRKEFGTSEEYLRTNQAIYQKLQMKECQVIYQVIENAEHNEEYWSRRLEEVITSFQK